VDKHLRGGVVDEPLIAFQTALAALPTFDPVSTEAALRTVADATGVKAATLIHAVRVAVTGRSASPGLFDVLALVGRDRTLARLQAALELISAPSR
jgi:glutamyl-tRNA synthetase